MHTDEYAEARSPGGGASDLERAGQRAHRSGWMDAAVRVGLVAYGVVHLLIAWVAVQLALGKPGASASESGALATLADEPFGRFLIWAIAVGLFLLVVWRILEAAFDHRGKEGFDQVRGRLSSLGKGAIYGVLGYGALRVALGDGHSGNKSRELTASLLERSGGQLLVGLIGLAIIVYGLMKIRRGLKDDFLENLDGEGRRGDAGRAYTWLGRAGYVSKGAAIAIVGCLFGYAALTHDAQQSGGLDQALREVLERPFGPFLLMAVAIGIGCYGLFSLVRARHLSR